MDYLLDSNIFIEAQRRYYGMDICPGFWDWLDNSRGIGSIASIKPVCDELCAGNDGLAIWADERSDSGWFLTVDDRSTQEQFAAVVAHVYALPFSQPAKDEFLRVADPWLIAKARVLNATVVTHEAYDPNIKRKILIPNICRDLGIPYLDTFDLLRAHTAAFILP